jgi:hypothetical protein
VASSWSRAVMDWIHIFSHDWLQLDPSAVFGFRFPFGDFHHYP